MERRLTARRPTTCDDCGGPIREGQAAIWIPGQTMVHAECPPPDPELVRAELAKARAALQAAQERRS